MFQLVSPNELSRQEDFQYLGRRLHSPFSELLSGEASQGVWHHNEGIVRDASDLGHRLAAGYKGLSANYSRRYAVSLQGDSVVHTAR